MTSTENAFYAISTFTLGALCTVFAHTSFTGLLEPLFFSFFDDGTITGMFKAMDAGYDTMMIIGCMFLLACVYFLIRYLTQTTIGWHRMVAIVPATLIGFYCLAFVLMQIIS